MLRLGLAVVLGLIARAAVADDSIEAIRKLYRALDAKAPTVAHFKELFGEHNEAELSAILAVHHPDVYAGRAPVGDDALEFARNRLIAPEAPSEFLRCIRRLRPQLFSRGSSFRVEALHATPGDDSRRVLVRTRGGTVTFVFEADSAVIEDIELPTGASVYAVIAECATPPPGARPGARAASHPKPRSY